MILQRISDWAAREPKKTAVVNNGTSLNYIQFLRAIINTRLFLLAQIERRSGVVGIVTPDLFFTWIASIALRSIGFNTITAHSLESLSQLEVSDLICVVALTGHVPPYAPKHQKIIFVPPALYVDLNSDECPSLPESKLSGGHILYTSGTTGAYKKVIFDAEMEDRRNAERAKALNLTFDTVFNTVNFSMHTGAGFKQPAAVWHVGGTVIFDCRVDYLSHLFDHGVNVTGVSIEAYKTLFARNQGRAPRFKKRDVRIMSSTGFLPLAIANKIKSKITNRLEITYSCTELVVPPLKSTFRTEEDLDWLAIQEGSIVEIVDEAGIGCKVGDEGYLRILVSDLDAQSYVGNDQATINAFRHGFFYPGDLAVARRDGRIRILGRASDVINCQGNKIASAPTEQKLQRFLGVDEVCLFTHRNDAGQDEIIVAVLTRDPLSEQYREYVREIFRTFESVKIRTFDEFPRTASISQKTNRIELRRRLIQA